MEAWILHPVQDDMKKNQRFFYSDTVAKPGDDRSVYLVSDYPEFQIEAGNDIIEKNQITLFTF
jgi:hypothetical protein